ncbi:MAG: hypothetical protein ACKVPJ_12590 [Chitinophagales bacterium]
MEKTIGLLTRTDWNSNKWQGMPSEADVSASEFAALQSPELSSLLYAHSVQDEEKDTVYQGFLPQLNGALVNSKVNTSIQIVFIVSKNPEDGESYITGFYAFPLFAEGRRISPYNAEQLLRTNIKTEMKNIHHLENYVDVKTVGGEAVFSKRIKGKNGFVFLTKTETEKVFDAISRLNKDDKRLHAIKFRLLKSYL